MKPTKALILAEYCGGQISGNSDYVVSDIKIDSRVCGPSDMFVCVVGEKNNGHNYVKSAYDLGCRCFLISEDVDLPSDSVLIKADNTVDAFVKMAEGYINQFKLIKVGVTGSVGKTTTKMLTACVLGAKYNTICTQKNYNTDLGSCLTAFSADEATQAIVFEMGMDEKGQIASYVKWIRPETAVITNIGISHLERLGSRDNIAKAKLEIVNEFSKENTLIVNGKSDYLHSSENIRSMAENKSDFKIVNVGKDIIISDIAANGLDGISFVINGCRFTLPLIGEHNAIDAALAVACGMEYGITPEEAAKALKSVKATEKRMSVENLNGIILIDDSYNASPDSLKAAIKALHDLKADRKLLVISDMLELGTESDDGHRAVGNMAASLNIDMILAVGSKKDYYRQGIDEIKGSHSIYCAFDTIDDVKIYLKAILKRGDAVLVKGSNSTRISAVAEYLREIEK